MLRHRMHTHSELPLASELARSELQLAARPILVRLRSAITDTMTIIRTRARLAGTTVQVGSPAECLLAPARGSTATMEAEAFMGAAFTAGRASQDAAASLDAADSHADRLAVSAAAQSDTERLAAASAAARLHTVAADSTAEADHMVADAGKFQT